MLTDFHLVQYADPVLDKLDIHRVVSHRLFRESCYNHKGNYVKVINASFSHVSSLTYLCRISPNWVVLSQIPSFWTTLQHHISSIPTMRSLCRRGSMTPMTQNSPIFVLSL